MSGKVYLSTPTIPTKTQQNRLSTGTLSHISVQKGQNLNPPARNPQGSKLKSEWALFSRGEKARRKGRYNALVQYTEKSSGLHHETAEACLGVFFKEVGEEKKNSKQPKKIQAFHKAFPGAKTFSGDALIQCMGSHKFFEAYGEALQTKIQELEDFQEKPAEDKAAVLGKLKDHTELAKTLFAEVTEPKDKAAVLGEIKDNTDLQTTLFNGMDTLQNKAAVLGALTNDTLQKTLFDGIDTLKNKAAVLGGITSNPDLQKTLFAEVKTPQDKAAVLGELKDNTELAKTLFAEVKTPQDKAAVLGGITNNPDLQKTLFKGIDTLQNKAAVLGKLKDNTELAKTLFAQMTEPKDKAAVLGGITNNPDLQKTLFNGIEATQRGNVFDSISPPVQVSVYKALSEDQKTELKRPEMAQVVSLLSPEAGSQENTVGTITGATIEGLFTLLGEAQYSSSVTKILENANKNEVKIFFTRLSEKDAVLNKAVGFFQDNKVVFSEMIGHVDNNDAGSLRAIAQILNSMTVKEDPFSFMPGDVGQKKEKLIHILKYTDFEKRSSILEKLKVEKTQNDISNDAFLNILNKVQNPETVLANIRSLFPEYLKNASNEGFEILLQELKIKEYFKTMTKDEASTLLESLDGAKIEKILENENNQIFRALEELFQKSPQTMGQKLSQSRDRVFEKALLPFVRYLLESAQETEVKTFLNGVSEKTFLSQKENIKTFLMATPVGNRDLEQTTLTKALPQHKAALEALFKERDAELKKRAAELTTILDKNVEGFFAYLKTLPDSEKTMQLLLETYWNAHTEEKDRLAFLRQMVPEVSKNKGKNTDLANKPPEKIKQEIAARIKALSKTKKTKEAVIEPAKKSTLTKTTDVSATTGVSESKKQKNKNKSKTKTPQIKREYRKFLRSDRVNNWLNPFPITLLETGTDEQITKALLSNPETRKAFLDKMHAEVTFEKAEQAIKPAEAEKPAEPEEPEKGSLFGFFSGALDTISNALDTVAIEEEKQPLSKSVQQQPPSPALGEEEQPSSKAERYRGILAKIIQENSQNVPKSLGDIGMAKILKTLSTLSARQGGDT